LFLQDLLIKLSGVRKIELWEVDNPGIPMRKTLCIRVHKEKETTTLSMIHTETIWSKEKVPIAEVQIMVRTKRKTIRLEALVVECKITTIC
jgi:hypothetical protein